MTKRNPQIPLSRLAKPGARKVGVETVLASSPSLGAIELFRAYMRRDVDRVCDEAAAHFKASATSAAA